MSNQPQHLRQASVAVEEKVLLARNVRKCFRTPGIEEVSVLRGVDFSIAAGEAVAIVGASGSGKSTLLHILGGLDTPDSGEVLLLGEPLNRQSQNTQSYWRNQHLGFVYQFHHLLVEFTALDNVTMPLLIRRAPRTEALSAAKETLAAVGLAKRMHHRIGELSGGERQRTAIARALVTRPDCILADEPTGNLDRHTAAEVFSLLLEQCRQRQASLLFVTHDQSLAKQADIVLNLQDGCLGEYL